MVLLFAAAVIAVVVAVDIVLGALHVWSTEEAAPGSVYVAGALDHGADRVRKLFQRPAPRRRRGLR